MATNFFNKYKGINKGLQRHTVDIQDCNWLVSITMYES